MRKILVTVTNFSTYCNEAKQLIIDKGYSIIENPHGRPLTFDELSEIVSEIDGVIAGVDNWNEDIFKIAPQLKGIARFGVGVDNIEVNSAAKHGIIICNSPGINTSAVAEHALGLILTLTRKIPMLNQSIRKGKWVRTMSHELKSQTIGFIGFGAIARNLAEKLQAFSPKMIAYDKYLEEDVGQELNVKMCNFDKVLKESDIISLHLPATPETQHLINDNTISKMKDGVLLINTSRGSIIEEGALYKGLKTGKIAGVATDVFETEPVLQSNPLFEFEQFIATPHVAAETYENYASTAILSAQALFDIFDGKEPQNRIV